MTDHDISVLFTADTEVRAERVVESLNSVINKRFTCFALGEAKAAVTSLRLLIFKHLDSTDQADADTKLEIGKLLSQLSVGDSESRKDNSARIIPVLVETAGFESCTLSRQLNEHAESMQRQIMLRDRHWTHDINLLLARVESTTHGAAAGPPAAIDTLYPVARLRGKKRPGREAIMDTLGGEGKGWLLQKNGDTATDADGNLIEQNTLVREFTFKSFAQAMNFMDRVAQGCDIADHHPSWTNSYKKLQISLSTWDAVIPHVTERDVMLAAYFDHVYSDYQ